MKQVMLWHPPRPKVSFLFSLAYFISHLPFFLLFLSYVPCISSYKWFMLLEIRGKNQSLALGKILIITLNLRTTEDYISRHFQVIFKFITFIYLNAASGKNSNAKSLAKQFAFHPLYSSWSRIHAYSAKKPRLSLCSLPMGCIVL